MADPATEAASEGEESPATQAARLGLTADPAPYLGVGGTGLGQCPTEPLPVTIASAPNGGVAFAGKSGRNTANV
jgi:hypothetical protein